MKIELHIERLVVEGLPVEQRQGPRLQAAVEQELARLLAAGGVLAQFNTGTAMAVIDGGTIQWGAGSDAAGIGKQIAAAVNGGLRERR
jgi:hypothetical protein